MLHIYSSLTGYIRFFFQIYIYLFFFSFLKIWNRHLFPNGKIKLIVFITLCDENREKEREREREKEVEWVNFISNSVKIFFFWLRVEQFILSRWQIVHYLWSDKFFQIRFFDHNFPSTCLQVSTLWQNISWTSLSALKIWSSTWLTWPHSVSIHRQIDKTYIWPRTWTSVYSCKYNIMFSVYLIIFWCFQVSFLKPGGI